MLRVKEESLKNLAEYLELNYVPTWAYVDDFKEANYTIESLIVEWCDGNRVHRRECNENLDILVNGIDYEEKSND